MPSPSLERHSYYLEAITSSQTLPDLSSIRTEYTVDTVINDQQKGILKSRYEIREMQLKALYTAKPGQAAPAYAHDPAERIAITHAQDDAQAFGTAPVTPAMVDEVFAPVEIVTVDTTNSTPNEIPTPPVEVPTTTTSTTPAPIAPVVDIVEQPTGPVGSVEQSEEVVPKKRTRTSSKDREAGNGDTGSKGMTSVTLSREIKLPIDGVQFSNNLFGITLTASTYEEAKTMIEEAFADFTESTKLISKVHLDKAYAQGLEDGKKSVPVPVPIPTVLKPATKVTYTTNEERARAMINQMANSSPAALEFAKAFTALNPMIPTNNLV